MTPYYQDDWVTIYHGDCREVMPTLLSVGAVLTDPPFGIGKAAWDEQSAVLGVLEEAASAASRIISEEGICFWFCSIALLPETIQAVSKHLPYRWMFMWHSPNRMQPGPLGFMKYTPALVLGHSKVHRNMADLVSIPNPSIGPTASEHPTAKPLALMRHLVGKATNPETLILDPFMGSGTTLRAAKDYGRRSVGIEIEERYCEIAARRMAQEVLAL